MYSLAPVHLCVFVCMSVLTFAYVCMRLFVFDFVLYAVGACACVLISLSVYVCMCMCICMRVCMCVEVCVCLCGCVCFHEDGHLCSPPAGVDYSRRPLASVSKRCTAAPPSGGGRP